jgi:hypothetical protein
MEESMEIMDQNSPQSYSETARTGTRLFGGVGRDPKEGSINTSSTRASGGQKFQN